MVSFFMQFRSDVNLHLVHIPYKPVTIKGRRKQQYTTYYESNEHRK